MQQMQAQAQQSLAAAQAQQASLASQAWPESFVVRLSPMHVKIQHAINKAIAELPMRLALEIREIKFGPEESDNPAFVVTYNTGKEIKFFNIDEFPTDMDIGRIALEAS
jgi:hypothetical protein